MTKNIISLTTIPSRFKGIEATLTSLLNQDACIDEVALYIPKHYRRQSLTYSELPKIPEGVKLYITEIDYGPGSKVLHALKQYKGQDVRILYCDDDNIYMPEWASSLIKASEENPNACIAAYGKNIKAVWDINQIKNNKDWQYRLKRILSLGLWNPKKKQPEYLNKIDIVMGFGGVLVKPEFFTEDIYDIPDIMWTVDDVWLSGNLERQNIEKIIPEEAINYHKPNSQNRVDELRKMTYKGHNRYQADLECIRYFQKNYDIWALD